MEDLFMEKIQELFLNANYEVDYEGRISKPNYIIIVNIQNYEAETKTANFYVEYDFDENIYEGKYKFTNKSHHITVPNIETPQQLFEAIDNKFKTIQNYYSSKHNIISSYLSNFDFEELENMDSFDNLEVGRVVKDVKLLGTDPSGQQHYKVNETYNLIKISSSINEGRGIGAYISFFYNPISSEICYKSFVYHEEIGYEEEDGKPAIKYSVEELTSIHFINKFDVELRSLSERAVEIDREQHARYRDYFDE